MTHRGPFQPRTFCDSVIFFFFPRFLLGEVVVISLLFLSAEFGLWYGTGLVQNTTHTRSFFFNQFSILAELVLLLGSCIAVTGQTMALQHRLSSLPAATHHICGIGSSPEL